MENILDNNEKIKKLDKNSMSLYVSELATQLENSFKKAETQDIPTDFSKVKNICLVGMGGSASASDIAINKPLNNFQKPIYLVRHPEIPGWVDQDSLVILISHSGETAETLSAFQKASEKKAKLIIIAEQGRLEELGENHGALVFDYDTKAEPRASLGFQLGFLLSILNRLDILKINLPQIIQTLNQENEKLLPKIATAENPAKTLAFKLFDHQPVVLAGESLKSIARRFKNQFNENAKTFASFDVLPEAMHNSLEGTSFPKRLRDDNFYLILKSSVDGDFITPRLNVFAKTLEDKKIQYEILESTADSLLAQQLSLVLLGDWASYYLAILNNVDPTPVSTIKKAKKDLS